MRFNSFSYLIFLVILVLTFYIIPPKYRKVLLLVASLFFYGSWNPIYILLILFVVLFNYIIANTYNRKHNQNMYLLLLFLGNIGILSYFKYTDFIIGNINQLMESNFDLINVLIPLGISFYIFQAMSHSLDVVKYNKKPIKSIIDFSLFITFFPQLIAGPIVRTYELIPQFNFNNNINFNMIFEGLRRIVLGLFLKVVLADTIASFVDKGFEADISLLSSVDILGLIVGFGFQIYFDFAGYSAIAIGSALLLGIRLPENFNYPYVAKNPQEFWHRWHITLSNWIRDYIYILLGGSKNGYIKTLFNLLLAMAICGLWHGASWTFAVWGIYHGLLLILHKLIDTKIKLFPKKIYERINSFLFIPYMMLIFISWTFFRATDLSSAIIMIKKIFILESYNITLYLHPNYFLLLFFIVVMFYLINYFRNNLNDFLDFENKRYLLLRSIILSIALSIMFTITVGLINLNQSFIYFQF
jgi:alginate O-acetyltransferase complex protein AlgI